MPDSPKQQLIDLVDGEQIIFGLVVSPHPEGGLTVDVQGHGIDAHTAVKYLRQATEQILPSMTTRGDTR